MLQPVLDALDREGLPGVGDVEEQLNGYLDLLSGVDPDSLSADAALAFWVNLYNAGGIRLAHRATRTGASSVLRVPGAFGSRFIEVGGERLSLDDIEHAKVRRFGDPRIHAALVCGSLSCPTLRSTPFSGESLDLELENQMTGFLVRGGARRRDDGSLALSRIFLWYGADFVRPHRMPSFLPVTRAAVVGAISSWLPSDARHPDRIVFQDYDWALGCAIG